jgi:FkbM family methyltransferase
MIGDERHRFEFVSREDKVDKWVIEEVYQRNEYLKDFILPFVPQDGIVVDVGAHIGCFTILAGEKFKPKIIAAIEPDFSNFDYLLKNILASGLIDIVRPFRIALWNATGNCRLYSGGGNTGGNSFFPEKLSIEGADISAVTGIDVPVTTLDVLLQDLGLEREQIGILKIDVEGAEAQILEGSVKTLSKTAVVVGEFHEALVPREKLERLLHDYVVAFGVPFPPVNVTKFWAVKKELVRLDSGKQFIQQAHVAALEDTIWRFKHNIADLERRLDETANWTTNLDRELKSRDELVANLQSQLQQKEEELRNLREKERQLAHLTAERDRLNQEIKQFRATVQNLQQTLDAKGHELIQLRTEREGLINRLQFSTRVHEQELELIKNTIGWKVLNKYRETRQKSAVLRYLHFLLKEPVKRIFKSKIDIRHGANNLTSPSDLSADARLQCPSTSARSVLVLGPWLPAMDRAAGGLRAFNILQILREEGYIVVCGADREKSDHVWLFGSKQELNQNEVIFERLNIEVLYGSKAVLHHLHEKGYEYRFVVLSYPEVAYRYLSYVRAYAINAKVIYDPVDLHWLRMKRESGIKDDDVLRQQSENYRKMERFNAAAADIVFAVTQEERSHILKDVKDANVEVIPTIHACVDSVKPLAGRKNLLFVGHYAHSPNEDAVCYFVKEILPLIRQDIPGVVFYMVGSHITEAVQSLASRDVVAVGYAPDLTPYLEGCRVFVAPLRYGAGIKGKIGQSMGFGLPVVTTSIGTEGMNLIDGEHVLIGDSPATFARAVVRLYTDDLLWEKMSQNALLHIKSNFSKAVVQTKLAQILATECDGLPALVAKVG